MKIKSFKELQDLTEKKRFKDLIHLENVIKRSFEN